VHPEAVSFLSTTPLVSSFPCKGSGTRSSTPSRRYPQVEPLPVTALSPTVNTRHAVRHRVLPRASCSVEDPIRFPMSYAACQSVEGSWDSPSYIWIDRWIMYVNTKPAGGYVAFLSRIRRRGEKVRIWIQFALLKDPYPRSHQSSTPTFGTTSIFTNRPHIYNNPVFKPVSSSTKPCHLFIVTGVCPYCSRLETYQTSSSMPGKQQTYNQTQERSTPHRPTFT
jgi:hypothetical protein